MLFIVLMMTESTPHLDSDALDEQLRRFEAAVDRSDPSQMVLLEEMREHTRRLHQARGDWDKPSTFRNWNDPAPRATSTAPLAIESYREYKNYIAKESVPLEQIARGAEPKLLPPPLPDPRS